MTLDLAAVDAALISAQPVLAVTAYPILAITAGVAWWLRGEEPDDDFGVADYAAPIVARAAVRPVRPVDMPTEVVHLTAANILPAAPAGADAGSPMYAELTARRWLAQLGEQARSEATA